MTRAHLKTRTASTSTVSDTAVAGAALTHAELDSNLINLRDSSWGIADDSSTVLQVSDDKTITIAGGSGITTALSGDTLTITASESQPVFKTISVAGQSDVVADGTTDTLTLAEGSGITITTNAGTDTITIASTASGTITALNNQAANRLTTIGSTTTELDGEANLTFDGSTLAITGNMTASTTIGATTNITAGGSITAGTSIGNDAITIDDNKITTSRSNDNLFLTANGTGRVDVIESLGDSALWHNWNSTPDRVKGFRASLEDLSVDANTVGRQYGHAFHIGNKLTNGSSSNGNWRPRALLSTSIVDMDGNDYTLSGSSRGPNGFNVGAVALNSNSSTAATLNNLRGMASGAAIADFGSPSQNITLTNAISVQGGVYVEGNGSNDKTITNGYSFWADGYVDESGSGTSAITNLYAYYAQGTAGTNNYAFYSASDTAKSRVGSLERYRETINALTSSSTISVDCGLAPVHTITLGTDTEFNISNLGTGQTATIIITQDGTGSRTATFGTDGSTAVKFAGGTPTLSTAAAAIDVITIFNDGTNYLGNIAQAFAA